MKRLLSLFSLLILCLGVVAAQEAQNQGDSKETKRYFPKQGDYGLGIDASPVLDFVGNMFNASTDNQSASRWQRAVDIGIFGRYFITDNSAIRVQLQFPTGSDVREERNHLEDEAGREQPGINNALVEDCLVFRKTEYLFRAGYMRTRGKNRLLGYYGGDLAYGFDRMNTTFHYGNRMNTENPTPKTTKSRRYKRGGQEQFGHYLFDKSAPLTTDAERTLYEDNGIRHKLGIDAFAGVEFYFIQNACIGFQVGVECMMEFAGKGLRRTEQIAKGAYFVKEETVGERDTNISFKTQTPFFGNFYLMFHF